MMTIRVGYSLRKRKRAEPATALLLLIDDPVELLDLCAQLGPELPRIHRVADGFLLQRSEPITTVFPRTVRLRALCRNLLLPADADLVPALHDDEARGLVSREGLVFLPGGRVLAFGEPMPLPELLNAACLPSREWQPFPAGPELADRIESIMLDLPQPPPEEILQAGAGDIGSDAPRPPGSSWPAQAAGRALAGLGQGLVGLGKALHLEGLARVGAQFMQRALEMAPRLSESILGRQEAALRELLRKFREGNLEDALRRALPLGGPDGRGNVAAGDAQLPFHNLLYSLSSLLGSVGPASVWLGGYDVQAELAREYRKAAEQAIQRGDYRRAAFIYGRLMQDYRRAADVLQQGGLFRDAALLYLHKLDDRRAAARAFESAGEIDQAVQLYRQMSDHVAAGEVLRRAGDLEVAVAEFRIAAEKQAEAGDYLSAGDLMKNRADRHDLAHDYWAKGWGQRPAVNAVACALQLARLHADRQDVPPLRQLVTEARQFFEPPGNEAAAGQFFNSVAGLADLPALASARDELRDQSLLGLAVKLRQHANRETRTGDVVSRLLGSSSAWPAAVVSDAQHGVRLAIRQPAQPEALRPQDEVQVGQGFVTAVCAATTTGEVFLGFTSGAIACYRPQGQEVKSVLAGDRSPVQSLSVDAEGQVLVALHGQNGASDLSTYVWHPVGIYLPRGSQPVKTGVNTALALQVVRESGTSYVGFWDGEECQLLQLPGLMCMYQMEGLMGLSRMKLPFDPGDFGAMIQLDFPRSPAGRKMYLLDNDSIWRVQSDGGASTFEQTQLGWGPDLPPRLSLWTSVLSWHQQGPELDLVGVNRKQALNWSRLYWVGEELKATITKKLIYYQAAALVRPGFVAAVHVAGIDWMHMGQQVRKAAESPGNFTEAVACFVSHGTHELLVVMADGVLKRVPLPS